MFKFIGLALAGWLLTSCSSLELKSFKDEKPIFKVEEFFNGKIVGWAIFQKRSGEIAQRFRVEIDASWSGHVGTLDETFYYPDGTTSKRIWTLKKLSDGKYVGTAGDVVGEAIGEVQGNAFNWIYDLNLKVGDSTYKVKFDDWMWMVDQNVVLNKSYMSKFGISLGELTLSLHKK